MTCTAFRDIGGRVFTCTNEGTFAHRHYGISGQQAMEWDDGAPGANGSPYNTDVPIGSTVAPYITEPAFPQAQPVAIARIGPPRLPYPQSNLAVPGGNTAPVENGDVSQVGAKPGPIQYPYVVLPTHELGPEDKLTGDTTIRTWGDPPTPQKEP